jgi:hypothetical protein
MRVSPCSHVRFLLEGPYIRLGHVVIRGRAGELKSVKERSSGVTEYSIQLAIHAFGFGCSRRWRLRNGFFFPAALAAVRSAESLCWLEGRSNSGDDHAVARVGPRAIADP